MERDAILARERGQMLNEVAVTIKWVLAASRLAAPCSRGKD